MDSVSLWLGVIKKLDWKTKMNKTVDRVHKVTPDSIVTIIHWTCPECKVANEEYDPDQNYVCEVRCINCDAEVELVGDPNEN